MDTRGMGKFDPHAYYEIEVRARYFKVRFYHAAGNGFAAVSGLRIFGIEDCKKPDMVQNVHAVRGPEDKRNCMLTWDKVENADGYIIRYGIAPDKLYNQYQVYREQVEIRTLTLGISYYFRVDSFNRRGVAIGRVTDKQ